MKVKSFVVTARPSARHQAERSLDTAVDAKFQEFLNANQSIRILQYQIAANFGVAYEKAFISIIYEDVKQEFQRNK